MKLFQQMLVAGASLSLLAPVVAQASDVVNLEEMNSYTRSKSKTSKLDNKTFINEVSEDIANLKGRVDGLEAQQNNFEAGAFSSTTSMDGKAVMWIGAVDGGDNIGGNEATQTGYVYSMNLNTSFNGDDNLYVRLKSGDVGGAGDSQWDLKETYHIETKDWNDSLSVDKLWYTTTIGDNITAFVGPRIENYYMYITPSIYKPGALKSMKLGGNANFGASTDVGAGLKWESEGGFGFATNVVSKGADGAAGMLGKTDVNKWDTQVAYTTDNWHLSATLSNQQNWSSHSYNATAKAAAMKVGDFTGYAFRGYWRPEDSGTATPEISVGYDTRSADDEIAVGADKDSDSYFVGLTWKDIFQADDRIGFAVTQPLKVTDCNGTCTTTDVDPFIWEAYYAFRPNDSIEVRPAVFGGTNVEDSVEDDIFGTVLTTTFKF
ncbi:iron uptake porin [Prochlorococcus marinus]|uniref:iron uptake porin n=1 Tax=Prochlorococcus marinus TaxID=1219 RepID=UPI001ADB6DBE|nr:iron uptake porin [Prochlorococcus marinus]MBO8217615.1 iron uptake porin [Prochlorococcus marinus XMU1405]MBW3040778.1 porin [Prochlorococcus marinus str. MU1405]MBW3048237.1 porin [Prochlorococcus marinus str. MU1406]